MHICRCTSGGLLCSDLSIIFDCIDSEVPAVVGDGFFFLGGGGWVVAGCCAEFGVFFRGMRWSKSPTLDNLNNNIS